LDDFLPYHLYRVTNKLNALLSSDTEEGRAQHIARGLMAGAASAGGAGRLQDSEWPLPGHAGQFPF
jgi:hypothetical protein